MSSNRSYENRQAGQQLYAVIEFCSNADTAFAKIESGKYDWLGMKDKTFVFGRPPVPRSTDSATVVSTPVGADGTIYIEFREPSASNHNRHFFATADEARLAYAKLVAQLQTPDGSSGMWKVRMIVGSQVEEETVFRTLPNIL